MSTATNSGAELVEVYVRLLGEGTHVFRRTLAEFLESDRVRLLAPTDYDPEDEDWEFKPGSVVRVEPLQLDGSEAQIAVALAE